MWRSLGRFSVVLLATCALAAACGSEDAKKHLTAEDAGAGGDGPSNPNSGGSKNRAGAPALPEGGGGGDSAVVKPGGGAAGQAGETMTPVTPEGGAAGAPPVDVAGAAGAGGAPQLACCQPEACAEAFPDNGWGEIPDDGCGHLHVACHCPAGYTESQGGVCVECVPDSEFCYDNPNACGDTLDDCGLPITCPDNCNSMEAGSCINGGCCQPSTDCSGICGSVGDGCGGVLDCGDTCDGGPCGDDHTCCTVDNEACLGVNCGFVPNGCTLVQCGAACGDGTACIDNACRPSVCAAQGLGCGSVFNADADTDEDCGSCPENESCVDNVCVPQCD